MDSSEESDITEDSLVATPPELVNAAQILQENLFPTKSKEKYIATYDNFMKWRADKNATSLSETILLAYFGELADKYKASSIWAIYSMLKSTLKVKNNINIDQYLQLKACLKRKNEGYVPKKSKILTGVNIENFINEAPDEIYLATKVALIFGITGALRGQELCNVTVDDVSNQGEIILVKVPNTKNRVPRSFVISGNYCTMSECFKGRAVDKAKAEQWYSALDYLEYQLSSHPWLVNEELQSHLLWVVALLALVYLCFLPSHRFRNTGVKYLTPVPLFGDVAKVVFNKGNVFENFERLYRLFPEERFVGMSEGIRPVVIIRDLELAKRIATKDFEHFRRHSTLVDKSYDKIFGRFVFVLEGQEWKETRTQMVRFFTTSMLRKQITPIVEVGERTVGELRRMIQDAESSYVDTDFYDICSHTNFDIIVSCVLGLRLDSRDPANAKLYATGTDLFSLKRRQILSFLGYQIVPSLMKVTGATMFSQKSMDYFKNEFMKTLSMRQDKNIEGNDYIDIILQNKKDLSVHDWFSQIFSLLIAGFDPVTGAIGMLVHELACNPEVQERLVQEIQETDRRIGGKIDYTAIQQMTYMDMVVSESLRMWSNNTIDRLCTEDYNLGRPNESATEDYIIRKGEGVYISMRAIHYDPQYFPEPTKFDPERFSKENRHTIPAHAYSPFGMGPRMCIGPRFAISVMKVFTYQLLRDVEVSRCEKTSSSIQLDSSTISLRNKEGIWVRLALRG